MNKVKILWQFSRPHTIIGSICSIVALYIIAINGVNFGANIGVLFFTIIAGLACNVFIVGLNQIVDVEIDKINKPYLPLAANTLSTKQANAIIYTCLVISLVVGYATSWVLGCLITIILIIGIAYSLPPIQLKKHHLPAAICITVVRGLLVNIGMFLHFRYSIFNTPIQQPMPNYIWPLTFFIIAFSIAIAWFKDLPDTDGDSNFKIKTLAILYSKKVAFISGSIMVLGAYIYAIIWAGLAQQRFLFTSHLMLLGFFILNLFFVKLSSQSSIKQFYLRFWVFFFAEYILFSINFL